MKYQIEAHEHGWLVCAPPGQAGVPLNALTELTPIFPKGSVIHPGIVHHYNATRQKTKVVFAIATPKNCDVWEKKITDSLKNVPPQHRWWYGTDTGNSSAAIFHVFCDGLLKHATKDNCGDVPCDADDFGRCSRLLKLFPEWRARLNEVATAYPETKWLAIVARWDEIEAATPQKQNEILRTI